MGAVIPRTPGPVLTDRQQLVLTRATFGSTPETRAELLDLGWEAWLDEQLAPDTLDDGAVEAMVAGYDTLSMTNAELGPLRKNQVDQEFDLLMAGEAMHNTLLRARYSRRQLYEVLVDFWTNHFNIFLLDNSRFRHLHLEADREVTRAHALGRFADMLSASANGPAMLVYLNNFESNANSPEGVNENYGRELLELHTLGIIGGGQVYDEGDMLGVAKVLSGWSIDTDGQLDIFFRFRENSHSTEAVSILDGAWSTDGSGGYQDGVDLLDFLAHHESTSRYVAWKLCRRFVADNPPTGLVESAAQVYRDNDTAIAPVVRHIFHSAELEASAGAKLRRPLDVVVATMRATDAAVDPDPIGPASQVLHSPNGILALGGQRLFNHHHPDGYPDTAADWVSADGVLRRWELAGRLLGNSLGQGGIVVAADALMPAHRPPTAGELVDAMANRLFLVGDAVAPHPFSDVPKWVDDAVSWLAWMEIAAGYGDGTYRPDNAISRAEVTNWLWKLAGEPSGHPAHGLTDVPAWIAAAVSWLMDIGVATGFEDGTYRPDNDITRAEVTNWLWKLADEPTGHPPHGLSDVPAWIAAAVSWIVAVDVADGYPDGTFRPMTSITRSQLGSWLWGLYHQPARVLADVDRTPLVDQLGGEGAPVTQEDVDAAMPDLLALVLATPSFQYR